VATPNPEPAVRVAVALVLRPRAGGGRWILIGHRLPSAHLPDLWEFPGGKIHPGESGPECARREVAEETGVLVEARRHLLDRTYAYHDRLVALEFHVCTYLSGYPQPLGCLAARWARPENLEAYRFPAANAPVLRALRREGWLG
jgi:mutator protein MutT